ncbi:CNNM domain-containing protein [Patescibacteria group bacterium]
MSYLIVTILVLMSGLFSGLTLGLLSLDKNELERKISLGDKKAKKIYAVRKRGNLLLCTLLLGNVAVNSTLAIFLGDIASGVAAGFIATGLIVIFGEIIPQATFSRYALEVGAKTAWLVKFFMIILFPICWPISWVLDKALGEEMQTVYSKKELMKIIEEHEGVKESDVDADEERIIKGALSYSDKTAQQIMTPRTVIYALDINAVLDNELITQIKNKGFTRMPVYQANIDSITGVLYTKNLIGCKSGTKIKEIINSKELVVVDKDTNLDVLLNMFIKKREHMALIKDEYNGLLGLVTLEDVIEEVLKVEIVDESDKIVDMQKLARRKNMK